MKGRISSFFSSSFLLLISNLQTQSLCEAFVIKTSSAGGGTLTTTCSTHITTTTTTTTVKVISKSNEDIDDIENGPRNQMNKSNENDELSYFEVLAGNVVNCLMKSDLKRKGGGDGGGSTGWTSWVDDASSYQLKSCVDSISLNIPVSDILKYKNANLYVCLFVCFSL